MIIGGFSLLQLQSIAEDAVSIGGRVLSSHKDLGPVRNSAASKGRADFVTEADKSVERAIVGFLKERTPTLAVLAEETGGTFSDAPTWLIDPIDGTTNFMRGLPYVGVSIALAVGGEPIVGAVGAPFLHRQWTAIRGSGATADGRRNIRVEDLGGERALIATGFPFRNHEAIDAYAAVFQRALRAFGDIRRSGAASLDLCYTAEGAYTGFFELGLAPWDAGAGVLIVKEAGGSVTDWRGGSARILASASVLAGAPSWHATMLRLINEIATKATGGPPW